MLFPGPVVTVFVSKIEKAVREGVGSCKRRMPCKKVKQICYHFSILIEVSQVLFAPYCSWILSFFYLVVRPDDK